MLLHANQSAFCLNLIDYDDPRGERTYAQRNRLLTNLQLTENGRRWETFGPLFYTDELQKLLGWLTDLLTDHQPIHQLIFREPYVRIQWVEAAPAREAFVLRFLLCYGAAPPWWTGEPDAPYPLTLKCSRSAIKQAVVDLTLQLRMFPIR